jgi:3-isopropylmalate/(R)-2-methylmalate dehydratase small subunit
MKPFSTVTGAAAPLPLDDVDTDQIIPSAWLKSLDADLAQGCLAYMRRRPDGTRVEDFVLERPAFAAAPILVTGRNFGCGSSREHAVWALQAFGVRCVIGHRPAEFFVENALRNGLLALDLPLPALRELTAAAERADGAEPFTVDLRAGEISGPAGLRMAFAIDAGARIALLEGLDDIGLTLRHVDLIEAWERRQAPAA